MKIISAYQKHWFSLGVHSFSFFFIWFSLRFVVFELFRGSLGSVNANQLKSYLLNKNISTKPENNEKQRKRNDKARKAMNTWWKPMNIISAHQKHWFSLGVHSFSCFFIAFSLLFVVFGLLRGSLGSGNENQWKSYPLNQNIGFHQVFIAFRAFSLHFRCFSLFSGFLVAPELG